MSNVETVKIVRVTPLDNYAERFTASAGGVIDAPMLLAAPQARQYLYIDRIVIRSGSIGFGAFILFARDSDQVNTREYVAIGPNNVAVEDSPVVFAPGEKCFVRWTGLDASVIATVILTGWYVQRIARSVPDYTVTEADPITGRVRTDQPQPADC